MGRAAFSCVARWRKRGTPAIVAQAHPLTPSRLREGEHALLLVATRRDTADIGAGFTRHASEGWHLRRRRGTVGLGASRHSIAPSPEIPAFAGVTEKGG
ncbi:hypothetical protein BF95_23070 [Sphingobium sp. Ant17]|nr:hypothetical protein BF95_23070 [Sphingobium sp. Ant17]